MHLKKRVVVVKCEEAAADRAIAFSMSHRLQSPCQTLGLPCPAVDLLKAMGTLPLKTPNNVDKRIHGLSIAPQEQKTGRCFLCLFA